MSIRNGLLAILHDQPAHGYGLKSSFEEQTAGVWPLNVGQVYTTLSRLERDGLVAPAEPGDDARQAWSITAAGRAALDAWYGSPVDAAPPRDELSIKVLLAVAADDVDVPALLQRQRAATMVRLQQYTRHQREADSKTQLPWILLLDGFILRAEAELKWLDRCEARLASRGD